MSGERFRSRYSDAQLIDAACEVISCAGKNESISQRRFNETRSASKHPDLPRADSICARLGVQWSKLCEFAAMSPQARAIAVGRRFSDNDGADWVADDQIAFALRVVAKKLGQTSMTSAEYRPGRAEVLCRASPAAMLPDEEQILDRVGSWPKALEFAGLPTIEQDRRHERDRMLFRALDLCLEHHGAIPSRNYLKKFAIVNQVFLPDNYTPYADAIECWRRDRWARGLETPEYRPHARPRPDFGKRVIVEPTGRIRRNHWTEELVVEAVRRFLESRRSGEPSTRKAYVDWSKGNRDAPSASMIDANFGGFARVRGMASKR